MMKKYIALYILMFCLSANFVHSQEIGNLNVPVQTRSEIQEKILQKRIELQTQIQEKQIEIKSKIQQDLEIQKVRLPFSAQGRVLIALEKIFNRFDAVIVKYYGLTSRIESRIQKMKDEGVDTVKAENLLLIAKTKLDDSSSYTVASREELKNIVQQDSSKEIIQTTINQITNDLKGSYEALLNVIVELKVSEENI
jgi:hypothetical protein